MSALNHLLSVTPLPTETELMTFAALLMQFAPYHGSQPLQTAGLYAVRGNTTSNQLVHGVYKPSVCIVAQGAKRVFLGSEVLDYDERKMLLFSVELPVASEIVRASPAQPFLCLKVEFDPQHITELAHRVYPHGLPAQKDSRGVCVGEASAAIVNAATRLLSLQHREQDAELLAPLVLDELLIRLLLGPLGSRLAQVGHTESHVQRVAQAVDWVREHFDQPLKVDELAQRVHMSASSLHQHFKGLTGHSPVQFQKNLRLREARRLMLTAGMDVGSASRQVGYASSSQFIREYGRLFGQAPTRDVARLREHGEQA